MDLPSLTKLVSTTSLLTEAERTFWLEYLPTMKPEQCAKLEQILTQKIEFPFKGVVSKFLYGLVSGSHA